MLDELIQRVIVPYAILGGLLVLAGIGIRYSILPEINTDEQNATDEKENGHNSKKSIFDFPYLILEPFSYFLPCRNTGNCYRYHHQLRQFNGNRLA